MKKKIKVFALLTLLLCVFAVSALAIEYVQLWEGGLYYAKTPLKYASDGKNVYFVWVDSTGNSVIDYKDFYYEYETPASNYGITDGWRIPTEDEMAYLFDNVGHVISFDFDIGAEILCTITGKNGNTLTLAATGHVSYPGELDNKYTEAHYATTGNFLYFDQNSSSCSFTDQHWGGQVILVKDPTVTVTFNTNGGSAVDPQTFDYGKTATKPTDPTQIGMTFTGWFTDADCTKAYDFSTAVKANTTLYAGWLEPDPIIIEGQNSEWSKDTQYGLKFRSDADYELFIRVEVDDKTVDPTNYTSAEGSTVIFLKPSFLQSLAGGKHKLAIVSGYKSGEKKAITSFTIKVPPLPPTGDSTPIALLTLLCLVSLGTIGLIQKKKKHN